MTPKERDFVAGLCATRAGLDVETERGYLMESRLGVVARREGYASISDLVRALRDRGEERLVWAVVEVMAPSASPFFRDPEVFERLADDLASRAAMGRPVRVWSAACAGGQEIFSLAMLMEERGISGVELFASDLSQRLIEKAQAGVYEPLEVQQGLSARRLVRHFENCDEGFRLQARVRQRVRWRRMNLMDIPAGVGAFDVILCRNVLGALLPEARTRVLAHLAEALRPGGQLVLGVDECAPDLVPVAGRPGIFEPAVGVAQAA